MNNVAQRIFHQILTELKKNGKRISKNRLQKSIEYCIAAHAEQKRLSGEPYWTHPLNVALILAQKGADAQTVIAAILHDIIEDTPVTPTELVSEFGAEVTLLVKGTTKLDQISQSGRQAHHDAANLQRILLAGSKDLRVMSIKLADKLHNLRTLRFKPKKDQVRIASQALSVFVPLAHKMGLHDWMNEMGDLCFSVINPKKFRTVKAKTTKIQGQKIRELKKARAVLSKKMANLKPVFGYKKKPVFGMYSKSTRTGRPLEALHDSVVLTVQTNSVTDCYRALGTIHTTFFPFPNKLKDFIAIPQANLYQALHTTVIGPSGNPFKVHIATKRMLELEHKGILGVQNIPHANASFFADRIQKLNRIFNLPDYSEETEEFMNVLTKESLSKNIFVFTPKGEIVELPFGSTPLDFAFKIRQWLGEHAWKARVNGRLVGFDTRLSDGNIVEIVPSRQVQLKRDWLDIANAESTKKTISRLFEKKQLQKFRPIDITIWAIDRIGLMSEITYVFETEHINISSALATAPSNETDAFMQFNISSLDEKKTKELLKRLRGVKGVKKISIERI